VNAAKIAAIASYTAPLLRPEKAPPMRGYNSLFDFSNSLFGVAGSLFGSAEFPVPGSGKPAGQPVKSLSGIA
jgi:hypothetical protein